MASNGIIGSTQVSNTTESTGAVMENPSTKIGLISAVLFVVVLIAVLVAKKKCHRNSGHDRSKGDPESPEESPLKAAYFKDKKNQIFFEKEEIFRLAKDFVIEEKKISLTRIIGKGQFGCVYEGTVAKDAGTSNDYGPLTHEKVAVKTLKDADLDADMVEAFLREGMIMKDFHHKHVLSVLGVAFGTGGIPMIVLPYMAHGSLKKYIGDCQNVLTVRDLLNLGLQIARGMTYLSEQKFVHRDLACRNCMLDDQLLVKVSDFGLSRDIYTKEYYASEDRKVKLPVKWMALESLQKSVYTVKTDVWAFGVVLWELMTRGATPYPDVSNWDVRNYIQSGRRMAQPEACPDDVYQLMLHCWSEKPEKRCSFREICGVIEELLNRPVTPNADNTENVYANLYMNVDAYISSANSATST